MDKLIRAAGVFNFVIPEWLEDDAVVGRIVGVAVHAGEVRRLKEALVSDLDREILEILQRPDNFLEPVGGFIQAIKHYRAKTGAYLLDAKKYVEAIRDKNGL